MTIDEFFSELENTRFTEWQFDGLNITNEEDWCPIWSVYYGNVEDAVHEDWPEDWPEDVFEAGKRLGLRKSTIRKLINAADGRKPFDQKLRERLLRAVKLLEGQI